MRTFRTVLLGLEEWQRIEIRHLEMQLTRSELKNFMRIAQLHGFPRVVDEREIELEEMARWTIRTLPWLSSLKKLTVDGTDIVKRSSGWEEQGNVTSNRDCAAQKAMKELIVRKIEELRDTRWDRHRGGIDNLLRTNWTPRRT